MTAKKTVKPVEPAAKKSADSAEPEGRKITISNHRRNCLALYGVTPSTFDGATDGLTGQYTNEEMKAIIDGWLKQEVK